MNYKNCAEKYGETTLDGLTVALRQHAYLTQGGAPTITWYEAAAIDAEGNDYVVTWTDEWTDHTCGEDGECAYLDDDGERCQLSHDDESNAANWDSPSSIIKS